MTTGVVHAAALAIVAGVAALAVVPSMRLSGDSQVLLAAVLPGSRKLAQC
jgi:hypothetical protein